MGVAGQNSKLGAGQCRVTDGYPARASSAQPNFSLPPVFGYSYNTENHIPQYSQTSQENKAMNYRFFGITALLGLLFFWLTERPARASQPRKLTASWYGDECAGSLMANCQPFDPNKYTCASWDYPLGTMLRVSTTLRDGHILSVAVVVSDRGPHRRLLKTRQLDLSRAAFRALAPLRQGLVNVIVEVL